MLHITTYIIFFQLFIYLIYLLMLFRMAHKLQLQTIRKHQKPVLNVYQCLALVAKNLNTIKDTYL